MRRWILLLVAGTVLTACSTTVQGRPSAAPGPETGATTASSTLPPRPRELPLDGVDPCSLLTAEQQADLGFEDAGEPDINDGPLISGPYCGYVSFADGGLTSRLTLVTTKSLEQLSEETGEVESTSVAGFPALILRSSILSERCYLAVGVTGGQFIAVTADETSLPPIAHDQLCRSAVEMAEQALRTLNSGPQ